MPDSFLPIARRLAVGAGIWLAACGGDDEGTRAPVGPTGPVELRVEGFLNDRGERFDRGDEVTLSCSGGISVVFGPGSNGRLENWILQPPGTCNKAKQCGYIALTVTSKASGADRVVQGATTTLAAPIEAGEHELFARLIADDSEPFVQDGSEVSDVLEVVSFVAADGCDSSGSGGGSSSGGSGGSGSGSGTGGAAGSRSDASGGAAGAGEGLSGMGGQAGADQG